MPKLAEATVAVVGLIVGVERVTEFGTDKYDGEKVLIATGDGYASVKLKPEVASQLRPEFGQTVAWLVRYGAYANRERQSDAQSFSAFVRPLEKADADKLQAAVNAQTKNQSQAA